MYYEYDTGYYEPSVMDELLEEFQSKCKEILLDDINSEIGAIKHENEYLKKENDKLSKALSQAEKNIRETKKQLFILLSLALGKKEINQFMVEAR